jgi:hypothetical protein
MWGRKRTEDGRDVQWVLYTVDGGMLSFAEGQECERQDLSGVEAQNVNVSWQAALPAGIRSGRSGRKERVSKEQQEEKA